VAGGAHIAGEEGGERRAACGHRNPPPKPRRNGRGEECSETPGLQPPWDFNTSVKPEGLITTQRL